VGGLLTRGDQPGDLVDQAVRPCTDHLGGRSAGLDDQGRLREVAGPLASGVGQAYGPPVVDPLVEQGHVRADRPSGRDAAIDLGLDQAGESDGGGAAGRDLVGLVRCRRHQEVHLRGRPVDPWGPPREHAHGQRQKSPDKEDRPSPEYGAEEILDRHLAPSRSDDHDCRPCLRIGTLG